MKDCPFGPLPAEWKGASHLMAAPEEKSRNLKHVRVYDRLYRLIQEGVYPPGSQLPSEPDLAAQMGVSRMTLRRALSLLIDDGLVKNVRGKGNFIHSQENLSSSGKHGLESLCHPVYACCAERPDTVEMEFRLEPPSEPIQESLGQRCAAVVIADRWYKLRSCPVAYSLSILPIEVISRLELNLNRSEELEQFLESGIYGQASGSSLHLSISSAGNFSAQKYTLSKQNAFLLIQENLYGKEGVILAVNKHFIPLEFFQARIYT